MSVLHLERLLSAAGSAEALGSNARSMVASMRSADGALWAEVTEVEDGFLVLSEWRSEADLEGWQGSAGAEALAQARDALMAEAPTLRRFTAEN